MAFNIIVNYATNFKRFGEKRTGEFDSIEIHSIGTAQSNAAKVREGMNQYNPGGIVHAIVSADEQESVLEILPWDNICWADAGYGNRHSFSIEICESNHMRYTSNSAEYAVLDQERFLEDIRRAYENAVTYTAIKCRLFGFDPLRRLSNGLYQVYSHQEAGELGLSSVHVDPTHIWPRIGKDMDAFRKEVKAVIKEQAEDGTGEMRYIVQVGVFAVKENAQQLAQQLRENGFEAIVKEVSNS